MSQYKPYPAYKDSGVEWLGQVPEHWDVLPLRAVASVNDDEREASSDLDEKIRYVDISTVSLEAGIGEPAVIPVQEAPSRAQRKAKVGDVVLSTVRTYLRAIGQVHKEHEDCIFSTGFSVIRAGTKLNPSFLYASILSEPFLAEIEANSKGVSYPAINASEVMFFKLPLPPKAEQEHIATVLAKETTRIDALVAKKTRFIELLREKRQALITHAVTKGLDPNVKMKDSGVEWLGEVPEHWEIKKIKRIISSISQGWSPECDPRVPDSDEWGVLKVGCVNGGSFNPAESKTLPLIFEPKPDLAINQGDVLVSRANTRELVGSCAVIEKNYPKLMLCDKLYRLLTNPKKVTPEFLAKLIYVHGRRAVEIEANGASSSMVNISQSVILDLIISLPSIFEQNKITNRIQSSSLKIDEVIKKTTRSIELLKERRSALITAAVTGQIDLREAA